MVYLGPINTLSRIAKTTAVKGYSSEQDMPVNKILDSKLIVTPEHDRRQQRDRRKQARKPVLETRGADRREAKTKVDITV